MSPESVPWRASAFEAVPTRGPDAQAMNELRSRTQPVTRWLRIDTLSISAQVAILDPPHAHGHDSS
jgi:hypothetical protein